MQRSANELTDVELLGLIATQRDEDAFSELFARYKRASYSLALTIVGDAKYAEEVVQEAMIRVWTSAGKFRTDVAGGNANPKGWILKIIAREASRALQRKHKRSKEISQNIELASPHTDDSSSTAELLQALRRKVAELAEEDRQLIALHFGGGLSQTEISETLSVSQQSVSNRIQRMLRELRAGLAASGFACATVAVTNHLESVLSSGYTPSSELQRQLMARLQARPSVRKTRRVKTQSSSAPYAAVAVAVSALAGIAIWFGLAGSQSAAAPVRPAAAPAAAVPATPVTPAKPAEAVSAPHSAERENIPPLQLSKRWVFDRPAPDLLVGRGQWVWKPEQKLMSPVGDVAVGFSSIKLPDGPLVFTLKGTVAPGETHVRYGLRMFFDDGKFHDIKNFRAHNRHDIDPATVRITYFIGPYMMECEGDNPVRILEHDRDHSGGYLVMTLTNLLVSEIEIHRADLSEIPAALRDPSKLTGNMMRVDNLTPEEALKIDNE